MPRTQVILFKEDDDTVPLVEWLDALPPKPRAKCVAALRRLHLLDHELRRPEADYLRDGIHELRVSRQGVNYRMLYFFHGRAAVVLSHGVVKERVVPPIDIEKAVNRRTRFEASPAKHSFWPKGY